MNREKNSLTRQARRPTTYRRLGLLFPTGPLNLPEKVALGARGVVGIGLAVGWAIRASNT